VSHGDSRQEAEHERYGGREKISLSDGMRWRGLINVLRRSAVKSEGCWKNESGGTRFLGTETAASIGIVDPDTTAALAFLGASAHFRSFCTTGDVGGLMAGATR